MTKTLTHEERVAHLEKAYDAMAGPRETLDPFQATIALNRALKVIDLLRTEAGPDTVGRWLDEQDRQSLYSLVVVLGLMVPDDQTPESLLAWAVPEAAVRAKPTPKTAKPAPVIRAPKAATPAKKPRVRRTDEERRKADRERKNTPEAREANRLAKQRQRERAKEVA